MSLIDLASRKSLARGLDYFETKQVLSFNESGKDVIEGRVKGKRDTPYWVQINPKHPRKSTCDCPFAAGRRVICKHMVALYFTALPQAYQDFMADCQHQEAEEEAQRQAKMEDLEDYVNSLSLDQLREELLLALLELEERDSEIDYWES